jgi:hypothetical protein
MREMSMADWQPGRVWETVRQRVLEWIGADDASESSSNEDEADPTLLFHMAVTAPMVIGVLILMRRAV